MDFVAVGLSDNFTIKIRLGFEKPGLIPRTVPKFPLNCQRFGINQDRNAGALARLIPNSREKSNLEST